jgi:hypothetical protein
MSDGGQAKLGGRGIPAAVTPTVLGLAPIQLLSISNDQEDNDSDLEVKRGGIHHRR